jgi:hypothetical protein
VYRRRRVTAVGVLLALVALTAGIIAATAGDGPRAAGRPKSRGHRGSTVSVARCPLTDLRAPGGHVPDRPALGVKIGNEPDGARPESGLDEADIVYDTPAEGGIMRYLAIYQCANAPSIGPIRSIRWVDWHIMSSFGSPILAYAGGIDPNLQAVAALPWLTSDDLLTGAASAGTRITSRQPPDNLYSSSAALLAVAQHRGAPPKAVFTYGPGLPASATPVSQLRIDFSPGTIADWRWNASDHAFVHGYAAANTNTAPVTTDIDAAVNRPVTATNVVVEVVAYSLGPYAESTGGSGDVESVTVGSGKGYVLRDGKIIAVTWHRPSPLGKTTFTDAGGAPVTLSPGRTFVELVLDSVDATPGAVTVLP